MKTKDFNLGTDQINKLFDKLLVTLKTFASSQDITLEWYIDGASDPNDTKSITIPGAGAAWDADYKWDSGIKWDTGSISFLREKQRKLKSGTTIAFGVKATGTNRFSLSSLDLLYELMRRES